MINRIFTPQLKRFWRTGFWLSLIIVLYLTLTPKPPQPVSFDNADKLFHLIGFFIFTTVFGIAYLRLSIFTILSLSSLLGLLIECAQYFVPNRSFSLWDWAADSVGVVLALIIILFIRHRYHRNSIA